MLTTFRLDPTTLFISQIARYNSSFLNVQPIPIRNVRLSAKYALSLLAFNVSQVPIKVIQFLTSIVSLKEKKETIKKETNEIEKFILPKNKTLDILTDNKISSINSQFEDFEKQTKDERKRWLAFRSGQHI